MKRLFISCAGNKEGDQNIKLGREKANYSLQGSTRTHEDQVELNLITTSSLMMWLTEEFGANAQELHFFNTNFPLIQASFVQSNIIMTHLPPFNQIFPLLPFHYLNQEALRTLGSSWLKEAYSLKNKALGLLIKGTEFGQTKDSNLTSVVFQP